MRLSFEDRIFIKNLHELKDYGAKRLMKEFSTKQWKKSTLNDYLKRLRETCITSRKEGRGRPRSARACLRTLSIKQLMNGASDSGLV